MPSTPRRWKEVEGAMWKEVEEAWWKGVKGSGRDKEERKWKGEVMGE